MLAQYFPVLMFLGVAIGLALVLLSVGFILGPKNGGKEKNSAYECGFEAFDDAHMKFDVRFYLVAIFVPVYFGHRVYL